MKFSLFCLALMIVQMVQRSDSHQHTRNTAGQHSLPTNRQLLVGYWGQNAAGPYFGRLNYEKDLRHFCKNYDFDIYVVAFVHRLFDSRNKDELPGMNFAHHCSYAPDPQYPSVFECATIGGAIRDCQKLGKKFLISLGGDTCDGTLGSSERARKLAYNMWNMFLGGQDMPGRRPFLSAVMDGVDLDIEIGSHKYYPHFVREIRRLMRTDTSKPYLITAAPQCPFPDVWMGPNIPGSALKEVGDEFDYLFIQFYNNYCYPGDQYFLPVLDTWLKWTNSIAKGPRILLGLPAGKRAAGKDYYYFPPDKLATVYQQIRNKPGVAGLMLWDSSWVQNNIINGRHYSEYAFELVSGGSVVLPTTTYPASVVPPVTTYSTSKPVQPRPPTPVPTTAPPVGPVDCNSSPDGYYSHPNDCSKFVVCANKVAYVKDCPPGLKFNKAKKYCDWPVNVAC